ncbi:hypothetical protein BGZ97_009827 [Linnemannia gamsii]|uniref:Uncharacterized protein n=1 Tax=Linnemannia gamsii TaxID=64522 RepID=A0A9P6UE30_9FUNG|nr:hypothetical protein BGZ97_009827 [Linnemannia gamsii]
MHTSVGSITTSDSFLEPHQPSGSSSVRDSPPHHLKAQFQHQYYRQPGNGSVTGSSATGSPPRFSEVYGADVMNTSPSPPTTSPARQAQAGNHYQTPSPEYRRSWFSAFRTPVNNNGSDTKNSNSNSKSGRWERTIQRRESSSSIASSETVSSSSTDSACDSNDSGKCSPTAACTSSCVSIPGSHSSDTGSFSSIPMTPSVHSGGEKKKCSSEDLSTIMVMAPPPPAYVSRRCEDVVSSLELMGGSGGGGVNEKQGLHHSLQQEKAVVAVLPEIAPLGDLMSEFAVDFGAIWY